MVAIFKLRDLPLHFMNYNPTGLQCVLNGIKAWDIGDRDYLWYLIEVNSEG